jgi:DNA polymerase-3 subunit delta'
VSDALSAALPPWLEDVLVRAMTSRAHALLLHAPGPLGQFELGMAIARSMLCEAPEGAGRACGRCTACHLFGLRSHPDVLVLIPDALREHLGWLDEEPAQAKAKTTKPSREIKVDAVREAIEWAQRSTLRGRAKMLLIHPAEAMNEIAANALLKTLEEPPGRLCLLLTASEPDALLPTVRSRCQRVPIEAPPAAQAAAWLERQGVAQAPVLLAAAGGLPHAALAMQEEGLSAATWLQVPATVRSGQGGALAGLSVARVIDAMQRLCHDLMCLISGSAPRFFDAHALAPARKPELPAMAALVAWERALHEAARHDEHPWHAPLRVEALLAQGAALWHKPRLAGPVGSPRLATLAKP